MRSSITFSGLLLALLAVAAPAKAQQWIQIPSCGSTLPTTINPSAATITVNPSGQICVLTGAITVTVPTPSVQIATPLSINIPQVGAVVSGAYADGAIVGIGSTADGPAPSPTSVVGIIALLKSIMANTLSPINVTGNFSTNVSSPLGVNIAATTPINVTVGGIVSPQNVTVGTSPVAVTIASSPVNVTGSLSVTPASPQNTNLVQVDGQQVASPSTYGVAPVGSVQGMNAFVTNNVNVTPPTPLQVTLPASPISVGIAGPTPLNVTVGGIVSPQNVTIGTSPVAVTIASSPVNVTGSLSVTPASPQNTNLVQVQGIAVASPSSYGAAPVGSVQGVNAFVTNNVNVTTPTPLQVTLPASPISVGIAGPTPLNVTLGTSPVSVAISTVSSPINVTGSFTSTPASPQNTNFVQINGVTVASPSSYGAAPVGSVQGVNAFVTNNVNVTPPTPLQVTLPASPISVGIAGPTPLNVTVGGIVSPQNVTLATSPVSVAISTVSSPVNVTGNLSITPASPQNTNFVQINGVTVASPSSYGAAPVGSVQGVNAFVTNNISVTTPTPLQITLPASPVSVGVTNNVSVTPPTPLQITLPASPISVAIGGPTPLNVTLVASPLNVTVSSPQANNLVQVQGVNVASPSTYGAAPVGSVQGVNAFVTNNVTVTPPTPLNTTLVALPGTPISVVQTQSPQNMTLSASPLNVTLAGPTPLNVTLIASPLSVALPNTQVNVALNAASAVSVAWTATPVNLVTNSTQQIGPTGQHQLGKIVCDGQAATWGFIVLFDAATSGAVTLGTTKPKEFLPLAPSALNGFVNPLPGDQYTSGIVMAAVTQVPTGSSAIGTFANCSVSYN